MTFFCKTVVAPIAIVEISEAFCNPKIVIEVDDQIGTVLLKIVFALYFGPGVKVFFQGQKKVFKSVCGLIGPVAKFFTVFVRFV